MRESNEQQAKLIKELFHLNYLQSYSACDDDLCDDEDCRLHKALRKSIRHSYNDSDYFKCDNCNLIDCTCKD